MKKLLWLVPVFLLVAAWTVLFPPQPNVVEGQKFVVKKGSEGFQCPGGWHAKSRLETQQACANGQKSLGRIPAGTLVTVKANGSAVVEQYYVRIETPTRQFPDQNNVLTLDPLTTADNPTTMWVSIQDLDPATP